MALHAERQVSIHRTPEQVFAFVADGLNGPAWRAGVLDVAHVSGAGVGAVYRQGVREPGGRRIAADYRISAFEPPRRLAFEAIAGPVRPTGEYRFEPEGDGTRLTFTLDAELGLVQRLLLGRAVQRTMEAEVAATERLKRHLEAGPRPE
jgi:carbon monoxide dehydrogenase subunit G